ncbi:MAG: SCO family protein [Bacteroidetes bacterium]|jgi:protein SCO1/2|nr:SCO family protein [Bacteroidota bacterium]
MKNIINSFIVCIVSIIIVACHDSKKTENDVEEKECCKKETNTNVEISSEIPDESLFNLTSVWKTQENKSLKIQSFQGKVTIAAMVFTHCEGACPRIVADIQRIEKSFTPEELKNIHFLLISMDPERDTPERCTEFAKEYQLNTNWTLISSSEDATIEMANVLNVKVKKLSGGGFDHSNTIHVINQQGLITYQQNGLEQEPEGTIESVRDLLKK